ncbi:MAG: GreA/GreB family elongation factor [Anaerolineae bacterium]|nr:GreA/GreB family elongation factor [Anaerolineae bacterium]
MATNSLAFLITDNDRRRLGTMLDEAYTTAAVPREHLHRLECNLEQAVGVAEAEVLPDVVTMNSKVEVVDLDSGEREVYTLVYPEYADIRLDRISVLAPIGQAILGRRAGCRGGARPVGSGRAMVRDRGSSFQPERAGRYQL